jgi:hypothetical protein
VAGRYWLVGMGVVARLMAVRRMVVEMVGGYERGSQVVWLAVGWPVASIDGVVPAMAGGRLVESGGMMMVVFGFRALLLTAIEFAWRLVSGLRIFLDGGL